MLRCNNEDLSPSFPELLVKESGMSGRLIVYGLQGGKSRRGNRNILTYITLKMMFALYAPSSQTLSMLAN